MAHMIYRAIHYGVAYVERGAEAYEERMRERAGRTAYRIIKSNNINEIELKKAFSTI